MHRQVSIFTQHFVNLFADAFFQVIEPLINSSPNLEQVDIGVLISNVRSLNSGSLCYIDFMSNTQRDHCMPFLSLEEGKIILPVLFCQDNTMNTTKQQEAKAILAYLSSIVTANKEILGQLSSNTRNDYISPTIPPFERGLINPKIINP